MLSILMEEVEKSIKVHSVRLINLNFSDNLSGLQPAGFFRFLSLQEKGGQTNIQHMYWGADNACFCHGIKRADKGV